MSQTNVIELRPRQAPATDEGWTLERCKGAFREAEEFAMEPRKLAFRDRDYYDNYDDDQWTAYEKQKLKERRQQIVTSNRIRGKVNATLFYVENAKSDPRAYSTREGTEAGAEIAEDALDYIERNNNFDDIEWRCAFDLTWSGVEAVEITIDGETNDIDVEQIDYERAFFDPRSRKADFSDSRYIGYCEWLDIEDAKEKYPDKAAMLDSSFDGLYSTDRGYEDKPYGQYGDKDRQRVRVVVLYYRGRGGVWRLVHFTGSGKLLDIESPWPDEMGRPTRGIRARVLYRNKDGKIFGAIRDWVSNQNEINQRKSRSLHLLSDRRTWGVPGWTPDEDAAKEALARPDGHLSVNGPAGQTWGMIDSTAEVQGNFELLQQAIADVELGGQYTSGNQQRANDQSGVALERLQMAGLAQDAPFFKAHKAFKLECYRYFWFMAKKFWQGPRAIPILTQEGPVRFLKINTPAIDPQTGQPVMQNPIAQIDVDFIIDTGPEMITLPAQEYELLKEIAQVLVNYPPQVALMLIEASPLKASRKEAIKGAIQQSMQQAGPDPLEVAKVEADVTLKAAQTEKTMAETQKIGAEIPKVAAETRKTHVEAAKTFAEGMAGPEPKQPAKR